MFGFSGWAQVLPRALAGTGSVTVVYLIVSRPFGPAAGLVSAFALAITPIFVAVSRNGTPDGLLIPVLLLAVRLALKSTRERPLPVLLLLMVRVGVGFNIKRVLAWIGVPAILIVYMWGMADSYRGKRAVHPDATRMPEWRIRKRSLYQRGNLPYLIADIKIMGKNQSGEPCTAAALTHPDYR